MIDIGRRKFSGLLAATPLALGMTGCEERNNAAICVLLDISASYYKEFTKIIGSTKALMAFLRAGDSSPRANETCATFPVEISGQQGSNDNRSTAQSHGA